jgi:hypothetical protein
MAAYHVASIPADGSAARKLFDFAKSLGTDTIVSASTPASLSTIDKLASEAGINVAFEDSRDLKAVIKDSSQRIGVSANAGSKLQEGLKDRLMVVSVHERSAHLSDFLLDISRAEPEPQESPTKCGNCSRPYSGVKPLVIALDATPAAIDAFEKAVRPAMGYRVEQITKVLPITSTDRVPAEERAKIEAALPRSARKAEKSEKTSGHRSLPGRRLLPYDDRARESRARADEQIHGRLRAGVQQRSE